jgi:hypothetical protein
MAWGSRLNRRRGRWGSRWRRRSLRRRRNVERNSRTVDRIQFNQSALPRLLGVGRRGHFRDFIILVGRKILIG